ncbi:Uma2 family endonuclease [Rubrimonas sp.]|uniref:Uma2 family endonuclease n=1 Tax=Rubrimonas sp. TaxID=2036015 RepID=UPI002FDD6978
MLDAPPTMVAEIIRGALHLQPRPAMPHAFAGSALGVKIGGPFHFDESGPGGWWIVDEPELHLGDEVVVPDLAGWRRERMPRFPKGAYVTLTPDWVCEILSPSTRRLDVGPKRAMYREHGVGWLWLVDPDARTLEAFALRDGAWVEIGTLTDADEVRMPPFDAISFPLSALWPDADDADADEPADP